MLVACTGFCQELVQRTPKYYYTSLIYFGHSSLTKIERIVGGCKTDVKRGVNYRKGCVQKVEQAKFFGTRIACEICIAINTITKVI